MSILQDYLTKSELADEFRVTRRTINRYMAEKDGLPFVLLGGKVFFRRSSVVAWLQARERQPNRARRAA